MVLANLFFHLSKTTSPQGFRPWGEALEFLFKLVLVAGAAHRLTFFFYKKINNIQHFLLSANIFTSSN